MNDILELLQIIESLGGKATLDEIASAYGKKYKMPKSLVNKDVIRFTLTHSKNEVRINSAMQWEVKAADKYLYVSDNKYFLTIRDAMLEIFNKSVPLSQGYFSVDDSHMVWFPQGKNKNWENVLSEDGRIWHETPKAEADYNPDNKLRYVFIHEDKGYRFTGLFKVNGIINVNTREYELVDDKVKIVKPRPAMIVCRIAYMKYYDGITENDIPVNGGSYVTENKDAFEKYNFHKYDDGFCYGFVETKYTSGHTADNKYAKSIAIEQINPTFKGKSEIDGVRVVLAAFSPVLKKTVVVGWYDNATIFRNRIVANDMIYMMKCHCEDAHLISEGKRTFEVPRASENEYGIGQSNFWYIQKFEKAKAYENELAEYLNQSY